MGLTGCVLFILAVLNLYLPIFQLSAKSQHQLEMPSIHSLTSIEVLNQTEAIKYGIKGVVVVSSPKGSPASYTVKAGDKLIIPILIQFRSYDSSLEEATISLSSTAGEIQQVYSILDSNGNVIEQRIIDISSIEVYTPSIITLRAGETEQVVLSLNVPTSLPMFSFYLSAGGVKVLRPLDIGIVTVCNFLKEVVIVP